MATILHFSNVDSYSINVTAIPAKYSSDGRIINSMIMQVIKCILIYMYDCMQVYKRAFVWL